MARFSSVGMAAALSLAVFMTVFGVGDAEATGESSLDLLPLGIIARSTSSAVALASCISDYPLLPHGAFHRTVVVVRRGVCAIVLAMRIDQSRRSKRGRFVLTRPESPLAVDALSALY